MAVEKKNVVVVGGGYGGTLVARELSQKLDTSRYNLILINDRPFYVHLPAMARVVVSDVDQLGDKALFGYDTIFVNGNGTTKIGKVAGVEEGAAGKGGAVVLENGERVEYATLIVATGSRWPDFMELPKTDAEKKTHLGTWRESFKDAKHVVVVGGGAVGIELAGEIKEAYPEKKVTLVHRDDMLLNDAYPAKFRNGMAARVRAFGVDVVLGDAVEAAPGKVSGVTTQGGKTLADADLVVHAFGSKPNTEFLAASLKDALTPGGQVRVNEFLEVKGHPGVFALGDIIDWAEQKQAAKAMGHAGVVSANVVSYVEGKPLKKAYKGSPEMIMLPLGKRKGAGYMGIAWGMTMGDFMTRTIKGKDLLTGMTRKARGLSG